MKQWQFVNLVLATTIGLLLLAWPPHLGRIVGAADAVSLAVEPASASLGVGKFVAVDIRVNAGAQQVDKVDVFLDFNPSVLQVVDTSGNPSTSVTPGTTLPQVSQNRVDTTAGQITYSACCVEAGSAATGPGPGSGSFVVATVRFKATAAGSSAVTFSQSAPRMTAVYAPAKAGAPAQNILTTSTNGTITVTGGAGSPSATATPRATPTPTATPMPTVTAVPPATAAPTLLGPDDGTTASDMAPLLRWTNSPGTTQYQIQVMPAPNPFTGDPDGPSVNLIIGDPALVKQAQFQVQSPQIGVGNYFLLPGMTYTWRVRTTTAATSIGEQDERWGPWAFRTFRTPEPTSGTITLLPPGEEVADLTPTLRWTNSDSRVFYYEVQVSQDPAFTTDPDRATAMVYWELRHGGVTDPINSYTIPKDFPLEKGKTYWWRVRPRLQGDAKSAPWTGNVGVVGGAETTAPACFMTATTDANGDVYLPPYAATFNEKGDITNMPTPVTTDGTGQPLPGDFNSGPNEVVDHWVDANNGPLTTLYPNQDISSPNFYTWLNSLENPCGEVSIGGETPGETADSDVPELENDTAALETLEEEGNWPDDVDAPIDLPEVRAEGGLPAPSGTCDPFTETVTTQSLKDCGLRPGALQGRDIIFVHGLLIEAVAIAHAGTGVALPIWPDEPNGFLTPNGFWKDRADKYWDDHIKRFLTDRGRKNRYTTIAYSVLQRLDVGRHAMLTQIFMAMQNGHAVVNPDPNDPRGTTGFCMAGCVIISHSTGALLTDVTMATAADPALAGQFAAVQDIPRYMTLHVSLAGAISGSNMAAALVAGAMSSQPYTSAYSGVICPVVNLILQRPSGTPCTPSSIVPHSVLVDLTPVYNKFKWSPIISNPPGPTGAGAGRGPGPMPTLTVASGSHENYWALKHILHLGLDDGVVTMDSGCGRNTYGGWPTGFRPKHPLVGSASSVSPLVFDLGINAINGIVSIPPGLPAHTRASRYYQEQTYEHLLNPLTFTPARVAAACTPYVSSWGMVEPVDAVINAPFSTSPLTYYPNHYPFVQTAESHGQGVKEGKDFGFEDVLAVSGHDHRDALGNRVNIMNSSGGLGIVDKNIEGLMYEWVKGPHKTFWVPINITVGTGPCGTPPPGKSCKNIGGFAHAYFNKQYHTVWLWKRTYHRFMDWPTTEAAEYVYRYALPAP